MKAAHADVGGDAGQEIWTAHLFRPMYVLAIEGQPSDFHGLFAADGCIKCRRVRAQL
jgi:hypothetical protein